MMKKPNTSFNLITAEEAAQNLKTYVHKRSTGIIKSLLTRWKSFNKRGVNGLEWGSIITIAGTSGVGKTAVAGMLETDLFELNPTENFCCLNLTFEMKSERLIGRKLSSKLGVSTSQLYSGEGKFTREKELDEHLEDLSKHEIYYLEDYTTVTGIKNVFIQLYHEINPNIDKIPLDQHKGIVLLLDHSILVKKDKEFSRLDALHSLCELFNELKKKYKGLFIILSQLNRSIESSERRNEDRNQILHFPTKSDIYGGDSLYQFSDIVLIIHRPEIFNITQYGPNGWNTANKLYFHYLKCREANPGIAIMINDLKNNNIYEE